MTGKRVGLGLPALAADASLKSAWGIGSSIGIDDQADFDRVLPASVKSRP